MKWYEQCSQGHNCNFQYSFKWMKSQGCPRRWVAGFMMDPVQNHKKLWMMHQPMNPVKIGVVNDRQHHKRKQ